MTQSLLFNCNGETAAQAATQVLIRQGLRVVRSFDLHAALATHADCECPHHGTEQCSCQFVVLLVYGAPSTSTGLAPVVVTTHSRDGQAEVEIVQDANTHPEPWLAEQVTAGLLQAALSVQIAPKRAAVAPANV
jgi:hypothetical protein